MAPDLENKSFYLLGRFQIGNHAEITKHIQALGGSVCKDWTAVQYMVVDNVADSKRSLVDTFEQRGGLRVSTRWVLDACTTMMDDGESDNDPSRSGSKADYSKDDDISGSSSCSKKRSRSIDEDTVNITSGSMTLTSAKSTTKIAKRVKADSCAVCIRATDFNSPAKFLNLPNPDDFQTRLTDLVVPLDSCYCGARTDKVLVDDAVWDATLSLTDITKNNNKFYIIQITSSSHGFYCFTRWGRVGTNGAQRLEFCPLAEQAKSLFHKKFRDKTKRHFHDRSEVDQKKGAYLWLQKEYSMNQPKSPKFSKAKRDQRVSACQLDIRVQKLVKLILDEDVMKKQVISMGLDMDKLPLGKLTKAQIGKGYIALSRILRAIDNDDTLEVLTDLSSTFYTLVPHRTYGRDRASVISTSEAVKAKLNLLQSLEDLRVGTNLLAEAQEDSHDGNELRHQLDINYEKLQCIIVPLDHASTERRMIDRYVQETHNELSGKTYHIRVEEIFTLASDRDERFQPFRNDSNRQLLWHSSRLGNLSGIISQGLRIAPTEAPTSGYRLGKGIYFSDSLRKSSAYCWASDYPCSQCLLLCEVALGKQQLRYEDDVAAHHLTEGYNSTLAVGRKQNDPSTFSEILPGVVLPSGRQATPSLQQYTFFENNELVVYDPARVRPRYLLLTTFERV